MKWIELWRYLARRDLKASKNKSLLDPGRCLGGGSQICPVLGRQIPLSSRFHCFAMSGPDSRLISLPLAA
jgi:hypothetical protein